MPGIQDIVNDTMRTMPQPSPISDSVIAEAEQSVSDEPNKPKMGSLGNIGDNLKSGTQDEPESGGAFLRDSKGNVFDPSIHTKDDEGNPKYNKDGSFRKKRGRKAGGSDEPLKGNEKAVTRQNALQAGKATAEAIFAMGRTFGGDEWNPIVNREIGVDEPSQMTDAWARYYEETGMTDIPAWAGVAIAMGAYALPRMAMPKTRTRMQRLGDWIKARVVDWKMKRQQRKENQ